MNRLILFSFLLFALLLGSCASGYRPIQPQSINYANIPTDGEIQIAYRYDVLAAMGNKKLKKKEEKRGVNVVAVKITNNSDRPIKLGEDYNITAGGRVISPLAPLATFSTLKQKPALHLLYLLLTTARLNVNTDDPTDGIPVGLAIGPGLAIGNLAVASGANKKFKTELITNDLISKTIPPNATVYGIIGMRNENYDPLGIQVLNP